MIESLFSEEDFDGEEWDEFSWMVPYLVQYGFDVDKFMSLCGPALKEIGGLDNSSMDAFLEEYQANEWRKQLTEMEKKYGTKT